MAAPKSISPKADEILDIAERLVRGHGYNGFSFRDIASQAGIKSASVHYHFPAKADLGVAVARRYTDRFMAGLGEPQASKDPLSAYVAAFRAGLTRDGQMCLCGVLGAENTALPAEVAREAKRFCELNLAWLERALSARGEASGAERTSLRRQALVILSALEGAMIVARNLGNHAAFDEVAEGLTEARLLETCEAVKGESR
jgi:TetR/AcrR family transcriptional regulator, transcriptional repressor for nem operon